MNTTNIAKLGQRIAQWIDRTADGPLRVLMLVANSANQTSRETISPFEDFSNPHELAKEIFQIADEDAEGRGAGTMISYQVLPYFGDSQNPKGTYNFSVFSSSMEGGERIEAPGATGMAAMAMRHQEQGQQLIFGLITRQLDNLSAQIKQKDDIIARLTANNLELIQTREKLLDNKLDRDIKIEERKMEINKQNAALMQENMVGTMLLQTLPMVSQKLLHGNNPVQPPAPGIPGLLGAVQQPAPAAATAAASPSFDLTKISKFFSQLDASQQMTLFGALTEAQRAEFHAILSELPSVT